VRGTMEFPTEGREREEKKENLKGGGGWKGKVKFTYRLRGNAHFFPIKKRRKSKSGMEGR